MQLMFNCEHWFPPPPPQEKKSETSWKQSVWTSLNPAPGAPYMCRQQSASHCSVQHAVTFWCCYFNFSHILMCSKVLNYKKLSWLCRFPTVQSTEHNWTCLEQSTLGHPFISPPPAFLFSRRLYTCCFSSRDELHIQFPSHLGSHIFHLFLSSVCWICVRLNRGMAARAWDF